MAYRYCSMTKKPEVAKESDRKEAEEITHTNRRTEVVNTKYKCRTDKQLDKRDGFATSFWITQRKQSGGRVSPLLLDCQEPIITSGLTSSTITDNTYRVNEMHGYPSVYSLETKREFETGDKASTRIIHTVITETKGLIGRSFATFVHSKYLELNGTRYSTFMERYKRAYSNNQDILYPVISRETLLNELEAIKQGLIEGRKLPMDMRENKKLFNSKGMPLISLEATDEVMRILKYEFKKGSFGFLKLYKTFPIRCTLKTRTKTFIEFIDSRDRYRLREDVLSSIVLYSKTQIPTDTPQNNAEFVYHDSNMEA